LQRSSLAAAVLATALVCSLAAAAGVLLDWPSWIRVPAALGLFALAPGAALLGRKSREVGLVIPLSLAISVLGAQICLWAGSAPGETATIVLVAACAPLLMFHGLRMAR
jgi:hypothetical protein